ncbi:MAG: creatininase family protein [Pseudomonadota bacterium]
MTHRWAELATTDFAALDAARTIALLPVGAIEQHGPHLPLGTDSMIADGIVTAALEAVDDSVNVLALPTQAVGDSLEHADFAGTLSQQAETLIASWIELGRSVYAAGLRKMMIFNAHGGQPQVVDIVAKRLRVELGMVVGRVTYFSFGCPEGLIAPDELAYGIHGGDVETSIMLHLHPDLVRHEAVTDFPNRMRGLASSMRRMGHGGRTGIGWKAQDINPQGAVGDATAATAEKGRALVEHFAGELALRLADMADYEITD